jgi:hypothetical protein
VRCLVFGSDLPCASRAPKSDICHIHIGRSSTVMAENLRDLLFVRRRLSWSAARRDRVEDAIIIQLRCSRPARVLHWEHCHRSHGRINVRTSHTQRRSSQPQLAAQPSLPNKHQSTPVTNSVCLPMLPSSLAGPPCSPPSVHTRHVMS